MSNSLPCPHCGRPTGRRDPPRLTVDAVVRNPRGEVLLVRRGHPPLGWALPGGFVEYGETLESAVVRELLEETGLRARSLRQFHTYSEPDRDPRHHTVSTVFLVEADGEPIAGDDAAGAEFFPITGLPALLAFDHAGILKDVTEALGWGEDREV